MKERISISIDKEVLQRLDKQVTTSRSDFIESMINKHILDKKTAVILAGGPASALKSNNTYRPLIRLKNKTLIEDMIEKLKNNNFEQIYIIGSKEVLSEIFKVIGEKDIIYIEETEHLGTAKSLALLRDRLRSTFLFLPCDHYFELDLKAIELYHRKNKGIATLVTYSGTEHEWKKSSIVRLEGNLITRYEETPEYIATHLTSIMIGFAEPDIFNYIPKSNISFSLQKDVFPKLAEENMLVGYLFSGIWKNIHSKKDAEDINIKR